MTSILVGVDGSPQSRAALAWAVDEARHRDADLHVLYVYPMPEEPDPFMPRSHWGSQGTVGKLAEESQRWREERDEGARRHAEGVVAAAVREVVPEDLRGGVHATAIPGRPARRLIERSTEVDLVVVGARGRGGFKDVRLGSVSQQCVRHAACPVVVVRDRGPSAAA